MIKEVLQSTGVYSDHDVVLFEKEVRQRPLEKGEVVLAAGEVARSIFFLLNGAVYQYSDKAEIDQVVVDLHIENEWFLSQQSFVSQKPSDTYICAYTGCNVIEISIESIHRLIGLSPAFFQLGRILEHAGNRVHFFDKSLSPMEKYQFVLENNPGLLQAFPLKLIASYLKMTPETLSRVREKMVRQKSGS